MTDFIKSRDWGQIWATPIAGRMTYGVRLWCFQIGIWPDFTPSQIGFVFWKISGHWISESKVLTVGRFCIQWAR